MNVNMVVVVTVAVAIAAGNVLAETNSAEVVEIADGETKWRFVAVEGTSQLPLSYMRTGDEATRTNLVPVTMPKFWIAERMVSEGEFAALMERKIRDGRTATQPLADIEWEDALHYCEKFTAKYSKELPENTFASMPTMHEWSHAVNVLDGKLDLSDTVGTFLFTMNQFAGVIVTSGTFESQKESDFDLAVDLGILPKRACQSFVGLRMVLVSWDGGQLIAGNEHADNRVVSRGSVLATYGLWEDAEMHLKQAIAKGRLSLDDKSRAEDMLEFVEHEHEYDFEDWSGLVSRAAVFAEKKGYAARPYTDSWQWLEYEGGKEHPGIVSEYSKAGVVGEWIKIGDLPETIRKDQCVGTDGHILIFQDDGDKPFKYSYTVTESNMVQVLKCDFTGDGIEDMVVEDLLSVGSGGYWYTFYEAIEDGGFKKVDSEGMHEGVQLVGLCAIPRIDGKGCGFIVIGKESNPVLTASILSVKDGKFVWDSVAEKSVYMLDARADTIYMPAPFIGAGYGIGFRLLESQGKWYRPVFWPWKQGIVQGHAEATLEAAEKTKAKQAAVKRLEALREKWPNAEDWISMWDMPDCAKRFFEIDAFQDWCNEDKKARYGEFEKACREAIAMKIEPPVWYYNLACALAVQGKRDEAFDALEQAVVAGYNEAEHAKCDSDFDTISDNPRFAELLQVMGLRRRSGWQWAKKQAAIINDVVELTADNVYFGFKKHCYLADVEADGTTLFYMDRDGKDDAALDGYVTVKYEDEAKKRNRHIGLANTVIGKNPVVARGTFVSEQIRTDAVDAIAVSQQNVLGLYACENWTNKLDWCILYRGGEKEGRRLAEIVRILYLSMPHDQVAAMLSRGEFAREMTTRIHNIVKEGKDGAVIDVADIDVPKLAVTEYIVKDGENLVDVSIRFGIAPGVLRRFNGLKENEELRPGMTIKLPTYKLMHLR